ncbi:MAG: translation initiation factor IF-2 N-terminal domain-containing protein, partial [Pseudomonadota bacterium]
MSDKIKVFELAPELGLRPLELVAKLKEIGVDVKSHMSEISKEDAERIKEHLTKKDEPKPTEKKAVVRKKKDAAAEVEAAAVKKPAAKPFTTKTPTVKKTHAPKAAEPVKAAAKTIIRRKKTIEEEKAALEAARLEEETKKAEELKKEEAKILETQIPKLKEEKSAIASKTEPAKDDKKHPPKHAHVTTREMSREEIEREKLKEKRRGSGRATKKDGKVEVVNVFEL